MPTKTIVFCFLISLLFLGIPAYVAGDSIDSDEYPVIKWSEDKWISDGCNGDIVYENDYLHVGAGVNGANYIHSNDNGETWSEPITPLGYGFSVEAEGNNVYCAYNKIKGVINFIIYNDELYFKKSNDCGKTWSDEMQLSFDLDTDSGPQLGVNGNTIHLIWNNPDKGELCYLRSITGGCIWGLPQELYPTYCGKDIAVEGSNVHIICSDDDYDLVYIRSNDNGDSWEYFLLAQNSGSPKIAVEQDDIYIVWRDMDNSNIYFLKSNDLGDTWGDPVQITSSGLACSPEIVAQDRSTFMAYSDKRFGNYEVCLRMSMNDGITWSDEVRVTNHPEFSFVESMDLNEDTLYLLWFDGRDDGSIYYKKGIIVNTDKTIDHQEVSGVQTVERSALDLNINGAFAEGIILITIIGFTLIVTTCKIICEFHPFKKVRGKG